MGGALAADEREVYLTYQVHNEAIVVPETIDCIRALTELETDAQESIRKSTPPSASRRRSCPRPRR